MVKFQITPHLLRNAVKSPQLHLTCAWVDRATHLILAQGVLPRCPQLQSSVQTADNTTATNATAAATTTITTTAAATATATKRFEVELVVQCARSIDKAAAERVWGRQRGGSCALGGVPKSSLAGGMETHVKR